MIFLEIVLENPVQKKYGVFYCLFMEFKNAGIQKWTHIIL